MVWRGRRRGYQENSWTLSAKLTVRLGTNTIEKKSVLATLKRAFRLSFPVLFTPPVLDFSSTFLFPVKDHRQAHDQKTQGGIGTVCDLRLQAKREHLTGVRTFT